MRLPDSCIVTGEVVLGECGVEFSFRGVYSRDPSAWSSCHLGWCGRLKGGNWANSVTPKKSSYDGNAPNLQKVCCYNSSNCDGLT